MLQAVVVSVGLGLHAVTPAAAPLVQQEPEKPARPAAVPRPASPARSTRPRLTDIELWDRLGLPADERSVLWQWGLSLDRYIAKRKASAGAMRVAGWVVAGVFGGGGVVAGFLLRAKAKDARREAEAACPGCFLVGMSSIGWDVGMGLAFTVGALGLVIGLPVAIVGERRYQKWRERERALGRIRAEERQGRSTPANVPTPPRRVDWQVSPMVSTRGGGLALRLSF
jgi:hypothetical protein